MSARADDPKQPCDGWKVSLVLITERFFVPRRAGSIPAASMCSLGAVTGPRLDRDIGFLPSAPDAPRTDWLP
jgi:hypothetical protein